MKKSKIVSVRPILLSAPYANPENMEVRLHLPSGYRTCGLVEVTLEDGTTGLGEGYIAVFAPQVFVEIVRLMAPHLIGKSAENVNARYKEMVQITGYWSLQGAARHVISACETALWDARAKQLDVPLYQLLGGLAVDSMNLYGSGGDSYSPASMQKELELLQGKGIKTFKIRAREHQVDKAVWTINRASSMGIQVAIDMTQNLANPALTISDVVRFMDQVEARTKTPIAFLEEALGPQDVNSFRELRSRVKTKVCGGEVVTTAEELCSRVERGIYDFVQPDATVIGGVSQTMEVFATCRNHGSEAVVHCWGGAVCAQANYHAAFAGGGRLSEWPMPSYPIREELMVEPLKIKEGKLSPSTAPGLGVALTPELEKKYSFRPDAIYACLPHPLPPPPADLWKE